MDWGLEIRKEVLFTSLFVEHMTSAFLADLLGIDNYKESKILGNRGGCLSFNQKVDLLIEIGAIAKNDRNKYQAFMEIRNQFMHNIDAKTYEKCFEVMNGTDKFILKTYPKEENLSREKQLELATKDLANDVGKITIEIKEKIEEKLKKESEADIAKKSNQAFIESIELMGKTLNNVFKKEIEKSPTFDTKRLENFGTEVSGLFFGIWKKKFEKLNEEI